MSGLERFLRAAKAFLLVVANLLRQLFHEVSALLFLILATIGVAASAREWSVYHQAASGDLFRPIVASSFALLMLWFGVTSLARARRIARARKS